MGKELHAPSCSFSVSLFQPPFWWSGRASASYLANAIYSTEKDEWLASSNCLLSQLVAPKSINRVKCGKSTVINNLRSALDSRVKEIVINRLWQSCFQIMGAQIVGKSLAWPGCALQSWSANEPPFFPMLLTSKHHLWYFYTEHLSAWMINGAWESFCRIASTPSIVKKTLIHAPHDSLSGRLPQWLVSKNRLFPHVLKFCICTNAIYSTRRKERHQDNYISCEAQQQHARHLYYAAPPHHLSHPSFIKTVLILYLETSISSVRSSLQSTFFCFHSAHEI